MLHQEAVEARTLALIKRLSSDPTLKDFVLVGGTALALRLGHRKSIDIDLFAATRFDPAAIAGHIDVAYKGEGTTVVGGAVFTLIEGIKTDLLSHAYPWIKSPESPEGVRMVSLDDIAAMKIHAIVNSGTRLKDYVDIHHLLERNSLHQIIASYLAKYPAANASIAKNALIYHKEIDFRKGLDLLGRDYGWKDVAKRLREAVVELKRVFQGKEAVRSQENKTEGHKLSKGLKRGQKP